MFMLKTNALLVVGLCALTVLSHPRVAALQPLPDTIALPDGWRPEGIVIGQGGTVYSGSLGTGSIYSADLRTGEGRILVGVEGRVAVGLAFDSRTDSLYVAGGPTGAAYVYDTSTGATVQVLQLAATATTFVNDVVVTRDAVYFTDSFRPVLYRVPLDVGGRLPTVPAVQEVPLGGDFIFTPGAFNANGIEATADGHALIVVNSSDGTLYKVDPVTGDSTRIPLDGGSLTNADGIVLAGRTLYVVQNRLNQIAEVALAPDLNSGSIVRLLTNPDLDIPTAVDAFGGSLYVVNARFSTPPTPNTPYSIVRVALR